MTTRTIREKQQKVTELAELIKNNLPHLKDHEVWVWDTETTTNWTHGPAGHTVDTKIVAIQGVSDGAMDFIEHYTDKYFHTGVSFSGGEGNEVVLVGHNLSFDVEHNYFAIGREDDRAKMLEALALGRIVLYDTQDMEYIATAHRSTFSSLGDLAEKYGVPNKKDTLATYFADNINTDAIPKDELLEYLSQDIDTTTDVALAQLRSSLLSVSAKQMRLACTRRALATVIQCTGMPFDVTGAQAYANELLNELDTIIANYSKELRTNWLYDVTLANPQQSAHDAVYIDALSSPKKLVTALFGGEYTYEVSEQVGTYKNGKPKFKKQKKTDKIPNYVEQVAEQAYAKGVKFPSAGADEPTLTALVHALDQATANAKAAGHPGYPLAEMMRDLVSIVLEYRAKAKLLNTYVVPLLELATSSKTGRIHPSINTTATATGRFSASKPNSQNMPTKSEVKKFFREDGYTCVEGDYKQLEMVALVVKTGDTALKNDLENGVDIHYEVGLQAGMWSDPSGMTKEKRRIVKSVDFGLVYGGGAKTLAAQSGVDVVTVKNIIDAFFKRYPSVLAFHKRMEERAKNDHGTPTGKVLPNGSIESELVLTCAVSGRKYAFRSYEDKYRKGESSFSPTELKNYLVQGLATGDFVPFAGGLLMEAMAREGWFSLDKDGRPKAKLCNTVHDSIVVWVKDEYALEFASFMKACMEVAWPMMFKFFLGYENNMLRKETNVVAEISVGPSWGETKELSFA